MTGPKIAIRGMPFSEPFSSYHHGPQPSPQSSGLAWLPTGDGESWKILPVCRPENVVLTLVRPLIFLVAF